MSKIRFTKRAIESLPTPASGRQYHHDTGKANLALCVTSKGSKTYYRTGRIDGRPVRVRIGKFPDLSIEQARKLVQGMAGEISKGKNPHEDRRARKSENTLEGLFDYWIDRAKSRGKKTWEADVWQFNKYLGGWKTRRLSSITKRDVSALHLRIGKTSGHYSANRVLALLRAMFNSADEIGYEARNPAVGIPRFAERSRDRFLQPDEVPQFFAALAEEQQIFQDFFTMLLLTGARKSNVLSMSWADIQLGQSVWRIPPRPTIPTGPVPVEARFDNYRRPPRPTIPTGPVPVEVRFDNYRRPPTTAVPTAIVLLS